MKKKSGRDKTTKAKVSQEYIKTFWGNPSLFLPIIGIILITLGVYFQTFSYDFVYWDDDINILKNENVHSFYWSNFWEQTKDIFTTHVIGNYNPLTIWTFGVENAVYGIDKPGNFHLINIVLHLICVYLVYRIGFLLKLNLLGAVILAFLFALHPMRVESVAWVTERKDVLYGVFFLSAIFQYLTYQVTKNKWRLISLYILFMLSLLAKIQAVSLPLVLIIIDHYQGTPLNIRTILSKWPYFILSLAIGVLGIYFLQDQGSLETSGLFSFAQRLFIGAFSLFVYLIKSIVPYKLSPLYPYPPALTWEFYAAILLFPAYLIALYWSYKKSKTIFFGLAFFIINIIFLLQILGAGQGFLADRFTYIAYIGLFFIYAYYLEKLICIPKWKNLGIGVLTISGMAYTFLSFNQVKVWENSESLWSKALHHYQNSTLPYGNRANYYRDTGQYQKALIDYNKSLSLKPNQAAALNSRAKLFFTIGKTQDTIILALRDYNQAIELDPTNAEYYTNRGATYARLGNMQKALEDINQSLEINPEHLTGISNRFVINAQMGRWQEALQDVENYLRFDPYNADFYFEKGNVKMILGSVDHSILTDLNTAISINPNKAIYHYRKCEYLLKVNRKSEAIQACNSASQLGFRKFSPQVKQQLSQ